jgi:Tol biopolymer transport system component
VRKIVATPLGLLTGIGLMLVVLLVVSAPALAAKERLATGVSFGPQGTGAGTFENVGGVTVDQTTGDVFVYDKGEEGRVYKFDAAGEPVDFSGLASNVITDVGAAGEGEEEIAVDGSSGPDAGDIYVANNREVKIYSAAGLPLGTLSGGEMCGVAVDSSGAVYVGIYSSTARKYVPTANPVTNQNEVASMEGLQAVCNVATDSEGNLYAATYYGGINKYDALQFGSPDATGTLIDGLGRTLTVDQATNDVYVNESNAIAEYDSSGNLLGRSGAGQLNGSLGIGISSAKNELYVPSEGRVMVLGAPVLLPTVGGGEVSEITNSTAKVTGDINPEGTATTYQFQYGPTTSYGSVSPASPQSVGSDSALHEVSTQLTGLLPSTDYHYRLLAINSNGTSHGQDGTFRTDGPPEVEAEFAIEQAQNSVVVGANVQPNGLDTHYQVEYGPNESYGSITAPVDMGANPTTAEQELTGLQLDTVYHYRFVVTNAEGTAHGPDETVTTAPVARIESESISGATNAEVTLKASVNDLGVQSTYYFEYGRTGSYGSATPEEALSSEARAPLLGLASETTYHFRVVVKNQFGAIDGNDATFTTAPSPSLILPDGRRYEKVSPTSNADGNVVTPAPTDLATSEGDFTNLPFMAAAEGNALVYLGDPSEAGGTGHSGAGAGNQYLSRRSPGGGWTTENIEPASGEISDSPSYQAFTEDLTAGFMVSNGKEPLVSGAPGEHYSVLYKRTLSASTGPFEPVFTTKPPNRGSEEFTAANIPTNEETDFNNPPEPAYAGSSADLGHVLFIANDALTPNAIPGSREENNLYDSHDGALTLVNVLPEGSTEPNATFGGPTLPGEPVSSDGPSFSHDISEDGRRIFWTDLNNGNLYLREDESRTIQVDAGVGGGGTFWTATPDGSEVLFTKSGDIYQYDVESGQTTNLTPGAEVQGIAGTSEDLSYVYFVADAALASGAEPQECVPDGGFGGSDGCNLYVLHQGEPVRFIATLSPEDNQSEPQSYFEDDGDWQPGMRNREAEVTPDGSHLVFASRGPLTGDASGQSKDIFIYDYQDGRISCASCNPTGESSGSFLPVSHINTYTPHWMSSDGTKVFFDSQSALVPQDTDGNVDVYEWEQDGAGSCQRSQGCIYLLSAGSSPESSWLLGAGNSGEDVFIATRSQLTPEDQNENVDVYDVRANAPSPPVQSQCSGSGCQGVPSTPPVFATPPSVTYNGVGNIEPTVSQPAGASKPLTRAQKLTKALKACKTKPRKKRAACEAQARKKYGPVKKKVHPSSKRGNVKKSSKGGK